MEYMVGALPSFSDAHVLRALFYLSHGVLSRKKLVELLGIGEGSVRTIIGRLSSDKLITSTKQGHKLTESGVSFVEKIEKRFTHPQTVDLGGFVSGLQSLVIFRGVSEMEWDWVSLRDESLKNGADGAVLIKYKEVL